MPSCGTAEIETSSDMSERQDSMEGIRAQVEQTGQAREVATPGWRGSLTAAQPQVEVHSQATETRQAGRWSGKDSALSVHPLTLLLELFVTNPDPSWWSREPTDGIHVGCRRAETGCAVAARKSPARSIQETDTKEWRTRLQRHGGRRFA